MAYLKVLLCIAFGLLALCGTVNAMCGVCSKTSYAACINDTSFNICTDGTNPSPEIVTCASGKVCTDTQGICVTQATGVVLGCQNAACNVCAGKFACVSQTEFAYCDANGLPGVVGTCPSGQVCNVLQFAISENICALSCLSSPTCQNTEVVTVAPPDWRTTCTSTTVKGFYQNVADATCKTYVYCEVLNGVVNSVLYTCPTGYFNNPTQKCIVTKPAGCT